MKKLIKLITDESHVNATFPNLKTSAEKVRESKATDSEDEKDDKKTSQRIKKKKEEYLCNKKSAAMAKFYRVRNFIEHMFLMFEGLLAIAETGDKPVKVKKSNLFTVHKTKYCNNCAELQPNLEHF